MATAICNACSKEFIWRAQRGVRLVDLLSPCCQSPGHAKPSKPSSRIRSDDARIRCKAQVYSSSRFIEERNVTISLFSKRESWNDVIKDYYRITPFIGSFKLTMETDDTCQFEDSGWINATGYKIIISKSDLLRLKSKLIGD